MITTSTYYLLQATEGLPVASKKGDEKFVYEPLKRAYFLDKIRVEFAYFLLFYAYNCSINAIFKWNVRGKLGKGDFWPEIS